MAGYRVMVVGDSCGYVEPFTGEGMSWAIRGAIAVTSVLPNEPPREIIAVVGDTSLGPLRKEPATSLLCCIPRWQYHV